MRRLALLSTLASVVLVLLASTDALAGGAPSETIVLINESSADSQRVGERYIAARQIPPTNVCRVSCTTELTVKRTEFVRDVIEPLRALLDRNVVADPRETRRTLRERARFVVLTQGMPIRADGPGGAVSTAEMLALLDTNVCGQDGARLPRIRNPYTSGPAPGPAADDVQLLLVTALISSTADEAIALIDRSVASDGTSPEQAHWVYQDAGGNAGVRNAQYDTARKTLEKDGHTTEHVGRGKDVVVDRKKVMGYMSGGSYSALSPEGVAQNEYLPGAICDMLQSFGAVPANFGPDGQGGSQFPVTHMVRAGVTGVQGTVAEPYSIAFPPADLFTPYAQGFTLAETFHQKIPFRYWMNLVLGDPLCAPYAKRVNFDVRMAETRGVTGSTIGVTAPGATRIEAFVDGLSLGAVDVDDAPYAIAEDVFAEGPHRLLVEVTGPGPTQPKAWKSFDLRFARTSSTPIALPSQSVLGAPLEVPLTKAPARYSLELTADGNTVAHTATLDGATLRIDIDSAQSVALAGGSLTAAVTLDGQRHEWAVRMGPAALRVEAVERVTAGDTSEIRVTAVDSNGKPIPGWRGTVGLHSVTPPVRWARASLDVETGAAVLRFSSPNAGPISLEVREGETRLTTPLSLTVEPGPPHHATTPVSRMPLGQVADLPIRFEDRFGNAVVADADRVDVSFPDDPHARGAGSVTLVEGRGVLRDVVLTKAGQQRVVIREGTRTWSQPSESVEVRPDVIRAWLTTRAVRGDQAAALFAGDPADGLHADGGVVGDLLFRRLRDSDATIGVPEAGSRDGDAAVAVAFVEALGDTNATLRLSAAARVRVLLDGEQVFDGVPEQTNPRQGPGDAAQLMLKGGLHRVTVVLERKGRFEFQLALAQEKVPFATTLRVIAGLEDSPGARCVSGRVLRPGGGPVADARIEVQAGSEKPSSATSASDGSWFVPGLANGAYRVRLVAAPGLSQPIERAVEVDGAHVTDVDLRVTDAQPPRVSVQDSTGLRAGRTLRIVAQIEDEGGIARAWLEIDGKPLRGDVRRGPWTLSADVSDRPRGALEVVVAAVDAAGNEARSAPFTVQLVDDAEGPTLALRGLSRNGTLRKTTTVTATAKDPLGVSDVTFLVNGVAQGNARTSEPYSVDLDPGALGSGRHELVCVARDGDGNETRKTIPFRVK